MRNGKAMTAKRIANLAREVDCLSKHAQRAVVAAVEAERKNDVPAALALFDKHAAAESRIKYLIAIPSVVRAINAKV